MSDVKAEEEARQEFLEAFKPLQEDLWNGFKAARQWCADVEAERDALKAEASANAALLVKSYASEETLRELCKRALDYMELGGDDPLGLIEDLHKAVDE